ncbi:MAG: transglycosylase domain-containing protein [Myxococcales bacterium]
MKRLWIPKLVAGLLLLACLPFAGLEALYLYGLDCAGPLPKKPVVTLSEPMLRALWTAEDGGPFVVEQIYSWSSLWRIGCFFASPKLQGWRPGERAANTAGRYRMTPSRPLRRHLVEWALSVWLTRHFSAAELTQLMADELYFGRGATGLDAASQRYFGKEVRALEPQELALLVGMPESPRRLSPWHYPERALARRNFILRRFAEVGLLTAEDATQLMTTPLGVVPLPSE